MKLRCSRCNCENNIQKFCGSCGGRLIEEETEIVENFNVTGNPPKRRENQRKRWTVGVLIFLLVWILGDVLLSIFLGSMSIEEHYTAFITFLLGIILMFAYVFHSDDLEIVGQTKD